MDQFVVSARKYRPATFNTVVGQDSITTTLKNAIANNHLAQAFLFCGPRGVGKTTCARILAKTINCTNLSSQTEGCNECESCVSFNNGQSLNIFELDAASNNSVDDIRNLVDQVRYPPQSGKYKIYIIDEVHMLSPSAFNAFLKTLEEPPPYAIFILATTEKHKIIPTILSRCQIFDFNRITIEDIARHLQWIAESEKVEAEPEALHLIAQKADGALRDALSIFDQIVSFAGNNVTYKHVIDNLNILDYEYYFRFTDQILAGDFPSAMILLDELIREGFDVHHFIIGLASHFRDLLVCKDSQTLQLLETGAKTKERYLAQSKHCSANILFKYLEICNRCDIEFKSSQNQRLLSELSLLKMCALNENAFSEHDATEKPQPVATKKKVVESVKENPVVETAERATKAAVSVDTTNQQTEKISAFSPKPQPVKGVESSVEKKTQSVPVARKRNHSSATISIAENLHSQITTSKDDLLSSSDENIAGEILPLDEDAMLKSLKVFAEKAQAEGRRQLAVAINKHRAILAESNIIEIPVDNAIQAEDIQNNKSELLAWMKQQLQNKSIEIRSRVVEENELKQTAYTPAEKFNKMAEKNPDLNQLKQQFDLELDF